MSRLEKAALYYASLGWSVFPLTPGTKIPLKDSRGCLDASTDPATIRQWWADHPRANIGLGCGPSGLVALDLDTKDGRTGPASWERLKHQCDVDDSTAPISRTPSGGLHILFTANGDKIGNSAGKLGNGIDVRGDGGYIVLPPSVLKDGSRYAWQDGRKPTDCEPPPLPRPVAELLGSGNGARPRTTPSSPIHAEAYARAALQGELGKLAAAMEGSRNITLNATAFSLGQLVGAGALNRGDVEARLLAVALAIGLPEREALKHIKHGLDEGEEQPRAIPAPTSRPAEPPPEKYPGEVPDAEPAEESPHLGGEPPEVDGFALTDLGNAERLASRHGRDLRFCDPWGRWLVWDGQRWKQDDLREIDRRANETVRAIYHAAGSAPDPDRRAALGKWAGKSEATARRRAMIDDARALPPIPILPDALDADPWLLNVANGTIDLRTGELRAHRREDLLTRLAPVEYDPDAQAPCWAAHLAYFLPNDNVRRQVQRDLGLAMVGADLEELLDIWYGLGANGKTTTARVVQTVLGDYAMQAAPNLLIQRRHEQHPTELADLRGARAVFSSEIGDGARLDEAKVKLLTGGDPLKARYMHANFFEIPNTWLITLICNHKPVVTGVDSAIWRRVRLVPWTVTMPREKREPQEIVTRRLVEEGPGILRWLLDGLADWRKDPQWVAPEVLAATAAYQAEQDTLASFLADCCLQKDTAKTTVKALYDAYVEWSAGSGDKPMGKTTFGRKLTDRGFKQGRDEKSRLWQGIGLLGAPEQLDLTDPGA